MKMNLSKEISYGNRWYDKHPEIGLLLEKLRILDLQDRGKIIEEMKNLIVKYDKDLIDRYVLEFPLTLKRRWYDEDPVSWMVINSLKYVDEDLLENIIFYLKEQLSKVKSR